MSKDISNFNKASNSQMFYKSPKCQSELFNIAYGVYIAKLLKEAPGNDPEAVNVELD